MTEFVSYKNLPSARILTLEEQDRVCLSLFILKCLAKCLILGSGRRTE